MCFFLFHREPYHTQELLVLPGEPVEITLEKTDIVPNITYFTERKQFLKVN